jgi:hypothetical protein
MTLMERFRMQTDADDGHEHHIYHEHLGQDGELRLRHL